MESRDGRKIGHEALEEIRIRAVLQVENGESPEVVIKALGFDRTCIYRWIATYREGGIEALKAKKLEGRPHKLSGMQIQKLYALIVKNTPLQFRFAYALWTAGIIRELIRTKFGVALSEVSVWRLLKKMGLSPQKPLFRAYQQDPDKVEAYLKQEYPKIKKRAKAKKARIFFADEASIRSDYHSGTTWAPKGETPVVRSTGARFSVNMISAITSRGDLRFMLTEERLTGEVFINFLKRLVEGFDCPIFLILDGHPVHHSVKVRKFVESTKGKLELYYFPGYSPELNPDETVWSYIKHHTIGKQVVTGPDQFKKLALGALRKLQKLPSIVRNFFLARSLRYAML
jgi:transposase